ncbi:MAG TPA: porin family protein [Rhizomicrobium sp.]|jgi:opacity protein-like surface antigen|nr:porin family protein [Rhizomicrobium sp.]
MKKYLLAAAAMLFLSAGVAQAQPQDDSLYDPMYVSILGGWTFDPALMAGGVRNDMRTGYNFGARVGYGLDNYLPMQGWSVEADTFWNSANYKNSALLPSANFASSSFMGDLIYHFDPGWPVRLYGGAGIGAVNDHVGGPISSSSTVLGWQVLGGLEYPMSHDMSLFTEYRYQNAHDANVTGLSGIGNTSNNVSVGLKFSL